MNLRYCLARLLLVVLLLGMLGLGLVASPPSFRTAQAAVTPGSLLYTWGYNNAGQLGDGTSTNRASPQLISLPNGATPTAIAAGTAHSLAIGSNGKLYTWGNNGSGQLGDGTNTNRATPVPISLPNGATPITIAAGGDHSLAIGSDGKIYAWGNNGSGQLGDGTGINRNTPVPINLSSGVTPTAIAAGNSHSLAIGNNGKLYTWGSNGFGALGDGTNNNRYAPGPTNLPNGATPIVINAGTSHSLVIGNDGKLYAWGFDQYGQLGNGIYTPGFNTPQTISLPNGVTPTAVAGGYIHSLVIGSNGKFYATGDNRYGQLGDGTTNWRNTLGASNLSNGAFPLAIVAGLYHSMGIGSDGKLYAWGNNDFGQLGNGTTNSLVTPVPNGLPNGSITLAIAAGDYHSLAIVAPPSITINNVTQNEGNSGTTSFLFTVSLSYATSQTVTVQYATADNTATANGNDYQPITGILTIPPNQLSGTITVRVNGDIQVERDETFALNLTNPIGANLGSPATGIGTILNDDDDGKGSCSPLVVNSDGDDGSCGTLRYAVLHAGQPPLSSKPKTITISLSAGTTIILKTGLILTTGTSITTTAQCGIGTGNTMLPPITILGVGTGSGNGLTLSGHNNLYGLWVRGFSGVQIKAPPGSSTKMQCVKVSKF